MKTLDEVIDAMERCSKPHYFDCTGCPYEDDEAETGCWSDDRDVDVLHYLRAFRDAKDTLEAEKDRYQEAVRNCEEAENKYRKAEQDALKALDDWASRPAEENKKLVFTVDNPPLTWSELKTMEGKPVWVEYDDHFPGRKRTKFKVWEVIGYVSEDMFVTNGFDYLKSEQGDVWQAYRKERG